MHFGKILCVLSLFGLSILQSAPCPYDSAKLSLKDGVFENSTGKNQIVRVKTVLQPSERLEYSLRLVNNRSFFMNTGRGRERLQIWRKGGDIGWNMIDSTGRNQDRPAYHWWEKQDYAMNFSIKDSFALSDTMRAWNQYYQGKNWRDPEKTFVSIALLHMNGHLNVYMDRILLVRLPVQEEAVKLNAIFMIPSGSAMTQPVLNAQPVYPEHYYPVDIRPKLNAVGQALVQPQSEQEVFTYQKIPFDVPRKTVSGQPCADLTHSWFREGSLFDSYEEPQAGIFGGRWRGALGNSPNRIQFRIPYRPYSAVYVLADCPQRPHHIPEITAQFYQPCAGFPKNFTPDRSVVMGSGLQLIRIPVNPEDLREFQIRDMIELELTGRIQIYKAAPDSHHYSLHAGGLPSGLRIYGVTLETDPVEIRMDPLKLAHVWVEDTPKYKVVLANHSDVPQTRKMVVNTVSYDGKEKFTVSETLTVAPRSTVSHVFVLPLRRYGAHTVTLNSNGHVYSKMLSRPRAREIGQRPFDSKGFMFGFWFGDHRTHNGLTFDKIVRIFGSIGVESCMGSAFKGLRTPENRALAKEMGFKTFWAFKWGGTANRLAYDKIEDFLTKDQWPASEINEPALVHIFAEPGGLGEGQGSLPEFYGEKSPASYSPGYYKKYADYKRKFQKAYEVAKRLAPDVRVLMPWGDPLFAVPFLKDPDTRNLMDGIAYDSGYFERMPEQQLHQCSTHRMYMFNEIWKRYRKEKPLMITIEGPCISPAVPGSLDHSQRAACFLRNALLLGAYGIHRQLAITGTSAASYWGEQHYSTGNLTRTGDPQPLFSFSALATLVRHLRHMEYVRWIPVGSLSAYCLEFKDARDGRLLHVLWTIRGTRKVKMKHGEIYDTMDNLMDEPVLSELPIFVYGGDGKVELEETDHSDQQLLPVYCRLGNMGQMELAQTQEIDAEYLNQAPNYVRRFPAEMQLSKTADGLSVTLPAQKKLRLTMPYYTVLKLKKPLVIPGRASHLTMKVTAHSDWGRLVYVLRDAKGERWISVGQKDAWNCDDMQNDSFFNFDGTRLVRFELPGNLAGDRFITYGSCWWGRYDGNGEVDLPLSLEKVVVERRTHAIYVTSPEPASPEPVVLGDLFAEYEKAEDLGDQSNYVRPLPKESVRILNPIADLAKSGTLPATEIIRVDEPDHYYDGTRGVFHFRMVPQAVSYDIYLSLKSSGEGAIKLGKNLKESGKEVKGFRANTTFHAFIIYRTKDGKHSKPSKPYTFLMKDNFVNK